MDNQDYLSDPDVQLMLEFQKGDTSSFDKLLIKYYPRLLNFIYRFVGQRNTAEDLTQEVFIKVYNAGGTYRPDAKLQTWLFTIAKNLTLNELRKYKYHHISIDETFGTDEPVLKRQVPDKKSKRPDQQMLEQERANMIKEAVNALPEHQRTAVLLRRFEDLSYEEIAKVMNTTVKAVKSLLSRAKENLKDKLQYIIRD